MMKKIKDKIRIKKFAKKYSLIVKFLVYYLNLQAYFKGLKLKAKNIILRV